MKQIWRTKNNQHQPHIVHLTSSLKRGGAESLLCTLVEHFNKRKIKQTVIYFHAGAHVDWLKRNSIETHHITGLFFRYDPIFWFRLLWLMHALQPTGIHAWLWAANIAARIIHFFFRIATINAIHNNVDQDGWIRNNIDKITFSSKIPLVAVSAGVAQTLITHHPAKKESIHVIRNGIAAHYIEQQAQMTHCSRQHYDIPTDAFVIGTVGRFVPEKNLSLLIDTFQQFILIQPHAHLIIAGSGPEELFLKQRVSQKNLTKKVTFIIDQPALTLYSLFDCFVLTSYKEGISMALLEAMSCRLACISTSHTPHHEVITDKFDGIVVPSENKPLLLQAFVFLGSNPSARQLLGHHGHQTMLKNFSDTIMLNSYDMLYNSVGLLPCLTPIIPSSASSS